MLSTLQVVMYVAFSANHFSPPLGEPPHNLHCAYASCMSR